MPAETFSEWFESQRFRHFGAGEFEPYFKRERNGVKNSPPPKRLWKNIVPTLRVVDDLRESFGKPCRILSSYRSPEYNRAVGGASSSEHLYDAPGVGAADFYIDGVDIDEVQAWCDQMWPFSLGYGAPRGFVHLGIRQGRPKVRWDY